MTHFKYILIVFIGFLATTSADASGGYELWLNYKRVENEVLLKAYQQQVQSVFFKGDSKTLEIAKEELKRGLHGMLDVSFEVKNQVEDLPSLIIAQQDDLSDDLLSMIDGDLSRLSKDGYIIKSIRYKNKEHILIASKNDIGVLYGVFSFLKRIHTNENKPLNC